MIADPYDSNKGGVSDADEWADMPALEAAWRADRCSDCGHLKWLHLGHRCGIDCPCSNEWFA